MRRSGIAIMASLVGLVKPLMTFMFIAIIMGVAGYLCAIFLTVLAAAGLLMLAGVELPLLSALVPALPVLFGGLAVMALLRGILHYLEQECNHYIAFKVLAIIRHEVFAALRALCPAKLEGRDRGNLISVITSDIELLEVFYAHTISPIVIALITSLVLVGFIGSFHPVCGLTALCGYLVVGVVLPFWNSRKGAAVGMEYRTAFGELNGFILDSLRGLQETIQYGQGDAQMKGLEQGSDRLAEKQRQLGELEGNSSAVTGACITLFSFGMLFLTLCLYMRGTVGIEGVVLPTVAMMSSFGPTAALSSLSNNLNQTLACGERVLAILEETPQVKEVKGKEKTEFSGAALRQVDFSYDKSSKAPVLNNVTMTIPQHKIYGIHGRSGSGKSTILKLLMRFWDVNQGIVRISEKDIRQVNTADLRQMESFVTQETVLFHNSIAENIAVGQPGASREEIMTAARKASVHDFIMTLPKGYDTPVGELGDTLSGGERQRIGIARAFLHDSPLLLLDEPTSNLDSLNEGIILKALKEEQEDRTVVLVSHRKSTLNIADEIFEMNTESVSADVHGPKASDAV